MVHSCVVLHVAASVSPLPSTALSHTVPNVDALFYGRHALGRLCRGRGRDCVEQAVALDALDADLFDEHLFDAAWKLSRSTYIFWSRQLRNVPCSHSSAAPLVLMSATT